MTSVGTDVAPAYSRSGYFMAVLNHWQQDHLIQYLHHYVFTT